MILQGDSGIFTATYNTDANPDSEIIQNFKTTAGGNLKIKTAGERIRFVEDVWVSGTELRTLMNIINDNSDSYLYTPDVIPPEYSGADFPLNCMVLYKGKISKMTSGGIVYIVKLEILGNAFYG